MQFPQNTDFHLRLTVTCSDGQVKTNFLTVYNENSTTCNPCALIGTESNGVQVSAKNPLGIKIVSANPTNEDLTFNLQVFKAGVVQLDLLDALGKASNPIAKNYFKEGVYRFETKIPKNRSGLQILRALQGNHLTTKKIMIIQ